MREIALLVEVGLLQPERVDDIDDLLLLVLDVVAAAFFGRGVGADVDVVAADGDFLAVGLVDGAVDFFDVVGVRDELVAGDDVLVGGVSGRGEECGHESAEDLTYLVDNHREDLYVGIELVEGVYTWRVV